MQLKKIFVPMVIGMALLSGCGVPEEIAVTPAPAPEKNDNVAITALGPIPAAYENENGTYLEVWKAAAVGTKSDLKCIVTANMIYAKPYFSRTCDWDSASVPPTGPEQR